MNYQPKNFEHLLGTPGFSSQLLKNHFKLYEGYVENTNKLIALIKKQKMEGPGFWELKRRFGWEFNGMRLHEYYFNNMVKKGRPLEKNTRLFKKISKDYGTYQAWEKEFIAMGSMRGIGWIVLTYDHSADCLLNVWINEHDVGHLAGTSPLLVMDVFEHAFMIDYGIKRDGYISAFFKAVNWIEVQDRYEISQEDGYPWIMKKEIL
jgi:Fe-Mn family superoxide dismutase